MDCRSKLDFNLDDDDDDGNDDDDDEDDDDDDEQSRLMDCWSKQDFIFNFLPTAFKWVGVNLSIGRSLEDWDWKFS